MTTANKTALVTGSSRGLGKSMALSLADKGFDVVLTYRTEAAAAEEVKTEIIVKGQRAATLQLDTADIAGLAAFTERFRQILEQVFGRDSFDYLVNNAGIGYHAKIGSTTEDKFDQLCNVHFKGPYFLTQHLLPLLADGGAVTNISTGLTRYALPGSSAYACMKGAMETFTTYLAKELGSRGIRANVVAPGTINTEANAAALGRNPRIKDFLVDATTMGRVGEVSEVGEVVAFLATDAAKWITAQRIEVSGGMFI